MKKTSISFLTLFVLLLTMACFLSVSGCTEISDLGSLPDSVEESDGDEEEKNVCKDYCDKVEKCSDSEITVYSESECMTSCNFYKNNLGDAGCLDEFNDYIECFTELSCYQWSDADLGDCQSDFDDLNNCSEIDIPSANYFTD